MTVAEGRVVVLMLVAGGHVGPLLAVAEVVGHVRVLVAMDLAPWSCCSLMADLLRKTARSRNLRPTARRDTGFRSAAIRDWTAGWLRRLASAMPCRLCCAR